MVTIAVCRNLYPSLISTVKYLESIDADIAVFPEEVPLSPRGWNIHDLAAHTATHSITLVAGHNYGLLVLQRGKIDYHQKNPLPIRFDTENGQVTGLARICAMALTPSQYYGIKADLLIISSSLAFSPEEIIEKHIHNLAADALVLMSTYEFRNCWATDISGKKTGEVMAERHGGYIRAVHKQATTTINN